MKTASILLTLLLVASSFAPAVQTSPVYTVSDRAGNQLDQKTGINISALTMLTVSGGPDFHIKKMEVILSRGNQRIATLNATSEHIDLSFWKGKAMPNDKVTIDIKTVVHKEPSGNETMVDVRDGVLHFTILK